MRNFTVAGRLVTDPQIITPDWAVLHVDTPDEHCIQVSFCGQQAAKVAPALKEGDGIVLRGLISISFRHGRTCVEFVSRDAELSPPTD